MAYKNLREFLERLEKEGELVRIREEIDPKFEISAFLRRAAQRESPAFLFEKVKGYNIPVIANLFRTRMKVALALETEEEKIESETEKRRSSLIPPVIIPPEKASVKEVIIRENIDIQKLIPVLTYHTKDISPYITQGLVFIKNPETGIRTMGIHRIQVKDKAKLGVFLAAGTGAEYLRKWEERGQPAEVAIALGADPSVLLAAPARLPPGSDKTALAGALRGEPLEMVKAETVDHEIPAHAMFIIEGRIPPRVRELDGPFGESAGYYLSCQGSIIEVTAITHQKSPIYSVFHPYTPELDELLSVTSVSEFQRLLRMFIPTLHDMSYYPSIQFLAISIRKRTPWDSKQALHNVLANMPMAKFSIVVDDDINVRDFREVAMALCGRFQPEEDLIIARDLYGWELDPSCKSKEGFNCTTGKIGLDATKPLDNPEPFEKVDVPPEAEMKAREILKSPRHEMNS